MIYDAVSSCTSRFANNLVLVSMSLYQASSCFLLCLHQLGITGYALPAPKQDSTLLFPHPSVNHLSHSASQLQPRNLALTPQNTSIGAPVNMERFHINADLVILISLSSRVENTTALFVLLSRAATYAQAEALRHGAATVLPGRISHTESDLEYEIQPPLPQASSRFTWGHYEAVTDWLYYYLVVLGYEVHCAFTIKEVLEGGRESQIGFGEVHALRQVEEEARIETVGEDAKTSNSFA